MENIIIYGNQQWAELVYFYITHDTPHKVTAFTVCQEYLRKDRLFDLPVVPFENIEKIYPPQSHKMLVAFGFRRINQIRKQRYIQAKEKGYALLTYVSPRAISWLPINIGENCIICESSVIHPFVSIGHNVVIASGAVISHHSLVGDHSFISPGAIILGGATIESNCFIGANSTVKENVTVAKDCLIGAGVYINRDTNPGEVYISKPSELIPKPSYELLNWHLLGRTDKQDS